MKLNPYRGQTNRLLNSAQKKAIKEEIVKRIIEEDKQHAVALDAVVLYTLHIHCGFGKQRLRKFYEAFKTEHDNLIKHYEMPDDYSWLCQQKLKEIGVDVEAWNEEIIET